MDKVGVLFVAKEWDILMDDDCNFFVKNDELGELKTFSPEDAIMFICKPWSYNAVSYYEDENGFHHYHCIVYDWIYIDIFAKDITSLFRLMAQMLQPSDELESILCDIIEKNNKKDEKKMSLEVIVRNKMNEALKSGKKDEKLVYSGIVTALMNKSKELLADLTPEQELEVVTKLAKQNQESIDTCPKDRTEILEKLHFERNLLLEFLPKQMSETEIREVISETLDEIGLKSFENKDKGLIMKSLMPKVKGKADGKLVNQILESFRG